MIRQQFFVAVLMLASLAPGAALAIDDSAACARYAQKAVEVGTSPEAAACGLKGPRYKASFQQHAAWCVTATQAQIDSENRYRNNDLLACLNCGAYAQAAIEQFSRSASCPTLPARAPQWQPLPGLGAYIAQCMVARGPAAAPYYVVSDNAKRLQAARDADLAACH